MDGLKSLLFVPPLTKRGSQSMMSITRTSSDETSHTTHGSQRYVIATAISITSTMVVMARATIAQLLGQEATTCAVGGDVIPVKNFIAGLIRRLSPRHYVVVGREDLKPQAKNPWKAGNLHGGRTRKIEEQVGIYRSNTCRYRRGDFCLSLRIFSLT